MRHLILLALIPVGLSSGEEEKRFQTPTRIEMPSPVLLEENTHKWREFLRSVLKDGDSMEKVKEVLVRKAVDYGVVPESGTGEHSLRCKMDDFTIVSVLFTRDRKMQTVTVTAGPERWLKNPKGEIRWYASP